MTRRVSLAMVAALAAMAQAKAGIPRNQTILDLMQKKYEQNLSGLGKVEWSMPFTPLGRDSQVACCEAVVAGGSSWSGGQIRCLWCPSRDGDTFWKAPSEVRTSCWEKTSRKGGRDEEFKSKLGSGVAGQGSRKSSSEQVAGLQVSME